MEKEKYDLIILGGGAAAFAAANTANKLKKRTLMINDSKTLPLGGTCVNVGCVPSKIMLHQGQEYYYPTHSPFKSVDVKGTIDFVKALEETREMRNGFRDKNYGNVIKKQKYIEFREGRASFADNHTVKVGDETYSGDYFLIATGSTTFVPPVKGIKDIPYLTNENVFELKEKPQSVIILGAGPQGMEFSQIFHHFGIKVTVIQHSDRILTKHDPLITGELRKYLEEEGITIYTEASTKEIKKTAKGIEVLVDIKGQGLERIVAERLFLGTGLKPHTNSIGAESIGIELDKRGFIKVNDTMQTSKEHIYAAGDVTGLMPLETVAAKQGNIAASNIFENKEKTINYNEIPNAVFTSPEVASVGITESEYMKKHGVCMCSTVKFDHVEKATAIKDTRGIMRMVIGHKNRQVLGVQIIGPMAADIITTVTYAIRNKMTIDDIRDTVHVFPTVSEIIKKTAQSFDQNLDDMACCVE